MNKTIKRYQLLKDISLSTFFLVNGSTVSVVFQNGIRRPELMRGWFSTDDPDLQAVIEADPSYNILFTLVGSDKGDVIPETPETKQADAATISQETSEPAGEPEQTDIQGPMISDYPEITLLKDARQKLLELFPEDIKLSQIPNKLAVLKKAKEKNITFSKLV